MLSSCRNSIWDSVLVLFFPLIHKKANHQCLECHHFMTSQRPCAIKFPSTHLQHSPLSLSSTPPVLQNSGFLSIKTAIPITPCPPWPKTLLLFFSRSRHLGREGLHSIFLSLTSFPHCSTSHHSNQLFHSVGATMTFQLVHSIMLFPEIALLPVSLHHCASLPSS